MHSRFVWAQVDLSAVAHNVRQIKTLLKPATKLCTVIKADGYGHGAVPIAKTAIEAGAAYLAVAILSEAQELRQAGIREPILILGHTPEEAAHQVVAVNVGQTVFSLESARALSAAAVEQNSTAKIHIKIDTGMSRIGIRPEDAVEFYRAVAAMPGISIKGVYSHFANADSVDKTYAYQQFARFQAAAAAIEAAGFHIPIKHIGNSAALLDMPDSHLDMVRAGIITYGLWPDPAVRRPIELQPAMQLKARVSQVKEVPPGTAVSYGCIYVTRRRTRIATIPVGYADGWARHLAGKVEVIVNGRRVPVVGRICMDQCMLDVTDAGAVKVNDIALLFGSKELPVEEIADHLGTINYEVICMIGKRVPREYPLLF